MDLLIDLLVLLFIALISYVTIKRNGVNVTTKHIYRKFDKED